MMSMVYALELLQLFWTYYLFVGAIKDGKR